MSVQPRELGQFIGRSERIPFPDLGPEVKEALEAVPLPPLLREQRPECALIEVTGLTYGVGKTEAVKALGAQIVSPGGTIVTQTERWWENKFLGVPGAGFKSEFWFLVAKYEDLCRVASYSPHTVAFQDVSPESDYLYAGVDSVIGRITPEEFALYADAFLNLVPSMVRPDLIVFLECDLHPTIFDRVRRRMKEDSSREFEEREWERIQALSYLSKRWLESGGWGGIPVLRINNGALDYVNDEWGKKELAGMVIATLRQIDGERFAGLTVVEK